MENSCTFSFSHQRISSVVEAVVQLSEMGFVFPNSECLQSHLVPIDSLCDQWRVKAAANVIHLTCFSCLL